MTPFLESCSKLRQALFVGLLVLAGATAQASQRLPISLEQARSALLQAAGDVVLKDVRLLAPVSAAEQHPQLTVDQMHFDPARRWLQARLSCRSTAICIPFFVVAEVEHPEQFASRRILPKRPVEAKPVMRPGQHATLLLERGDMRITLPVISLQSGAPGQTIRVRTIEGTVFHAEIETERILRGSL